MDETEGAQPVAERYARIGYLLQAGDEIERYGDALYISTPDPEHPKRRRIHFVLTVRRTMPPNVERIVSVEGFDPARHDHH